MTDYSLPIQYQEVEYIQATWTQYIDTWVVSNHWNSFEMSVYWDTPWWDGHILSQGNNSIREASSRVVRWFSRNYNYTWILTSDIYNKLEFWLNYLKINWVDASPTADSDNAVWNVRLFCSNLNTTQCATLKMAYCKIWDSNNELVRRFVPCYRISDGVIWLYDTVNNTFYTNDGTGTFWKWGNVIARDTINYKLGTNNLLKVCIWNVKVRPSGWQPWANTIAYYPLNWNLNDNSGNGYNLTNNWTTFITLASWKQVLSVEQTSAYNNSFTYDLTWKDFTISYFVKDTAQRTWYSDFPYVWLYNSSNSELFQNKHSWPSQWNRVWARINNNYPWDVERYNIDENWHSYFYVYNNTDRVQKLYVDWNLVSTAQAISNPISTSCAKLQVWWLWYGRQVHFQMWDLIIEDKVRTATEISDYYNQTKWDYWIS